MVDAGNGVKVAVAESDIENYPGLWLHGTSDNGLAGTFPPYPLKEVLERDRDYRVTETADYIAQTRGTRTYPWRLLGITEKDGDLITNQLVWLLEKPSQVQDTSWIKPGKVAWDWWNANNIYGVDFKSGVNTQTYKYYIDFAAKYGLQYVVLDEGWYKLGDVMEVVPEINMEELAAYAKQKNVGIILWVVWKTFDDKFDQALDQFQKWGVKGIKIDFMQRNDQKLIDFYYKTCRETAKRHMLVDFHGGQSQITMTRTWPNMISGEGVRGMEWSKWSTESEPQHNVTLPFTRMFLGPMDYTPGAMLNATKTTFAPIHERPMAMGTRCHQLGMYVVFESPLQMLADSPSNYMREPEAMEFLSVGTHGLGRNQGSRRQAGRVCFGGEEKRPRLVCWRDDQLDWPRPRCGSLFSAAGDVYHGCVPGWRKRRPLCRRLCEDQNSGERQQEAENYPGARWRLGSQDSPVISSPRGCQRKPNLTHGLATHK